MQTFSIDGSLRGELDSYWEEAFGRFLHTWDLVRDSQGRALELGANPYFLTWILHEFTSLNLSLANFFGGERGQLSQMLSFEDDGSLVELEMVSELFNMEEDRFPYKDQSFDLVLFCEIIEHLLMNPLHALLEIRRVLRDNGVLVITTPNAVRLENVFAMLAGTNIYDPYSGFGPYGRHNREYIRVELRRLVEFAGFDVQTIFTADSHAIDQNILPAYGSLAHLLAARTDDLGQYLFLKARATRQPIEGLPRFLYRSWPEDQLVNALATSGG
jgi:SAM-dependent methyltransferase